MKNWMLIPALSAATLLVACSDNRPSVSYDTYEEGGAPAGGQNPEPRQQTAPQQQSSPQTQDKPWEEKKKTNTAASSSTKNYPKGVPVSGKKGFVKSPYAEYAGLVDVRGFPSGTQVKCPYTQKIFVVP